ncbi:MAG: SEL1-like repeat protein [Desulfovibrio sp.]|jgi:TPR repeat protein|nr:SEL1-like repeat protein [Desulfovibrio sp.]
MLTRLKVAIGIAKTQNEMGVAYFLGEGVPEDKRKAAEWLQKADEQGSAEAQRKILPVPEATAFAVRPVLNCRM